MTEPRVEKAWEMTDPRVFSDGPFDDDDFEDWDDEGWLEFVDPDPDPPPAVTDPGDKIYFLQAGVVGPIKIGFSGQAAQRLRALQAMGPEPLTLLGWMPGVLDGERALHRQFKRSRLHGEWFRPSDDVLEFIRENARPA